MRLVLFQLVFFVHVLAAFGDAQTCAIAYANIPVSSDQLDRYLSSGADVDRVLGANADFGTVTNQWVAKAGQVNGFYYRGISLKKGDLENIFKNGLQVSKTRNWGGGGKVIYTSSEMSTGFSYGFANSGTVVRAVFEIDPSGIPLEKVSRDHAIFRNDIPLKAIKRIFVFDPKGNGTDFPFAVFRP